MVIFAKGLPRPSPPSPPHPPTTRHPDHLAFFPQRPSIVQRALSVGFRRQKRRRSSSSTTSTTSGDVTPPATPPPPPPPPVFTRAHVQEALQNLAAVSTAAEAVSKSLAWQLRRYETWRRNRMIAIQGGVACTRCEIHRWRNSIDSELMLSRVESVHASSGPAVGEQYRAIGDMICRLIWRRVEMVTVRDARDPLLWLVPTDQGKGKGQAVEVEEEDNRKICPNSLRRCEFCPIIECVATRPPRVYGTVGNASAAKVGSSSSEPCCAPTSGELVDAHHVTITYLALRYTLERLVKSSGISMQAKLLKITLLGSLKIAFGFEELREMVAYWLNLDRVVEDWGWVVPHDTPESWEEMRHLCKLEVEKVGAPKMGVGVFDEFNARLMLVGPRIIPSDYCWATVDELRIAFGVQALILEVRADAIELAQKEWDEMDKRGRKVNGEQLMLAATGRRLAAELMEAVRLVAVRTKLLMDRLMRGRGDSGNEKKVKWSGKWNSDERVVVEEEVKV